MSVTTLAIMGAGSVRCTPPVLAALATYFGERPLEIRLYDSDEERLDLFDRMARVFFHMTVSTHHLIFRLDPLEALEDVDRVVLQIGTNCARKYLRATGRLPRADTPDFEEPVGSLQKDGYQPLPRDDQLIQMAVDLIIPHIPAGAEVLSLQDQQVILPAEERFRKVDWPPRLSLEQRVAVPFQALRWMKGEDYPHDVLKEMERSPLKAWLDDVTTAEPITKRV